jgi:myotubularin-related protein 6/7/8
VPLLSKYHKALTFENFFSCQPIFTQFLDCVWQLLQQFPSQFGFSSRLLEFLADEAYVGRHIEMACNSQKQRSVCEKCQKRPSIVSKET